MGVSPVMVNDRLWRSLYTMRGPLWNAVSGTLLARSYGRRPVMVRDRLWRIPVRIPYVRIPYVRIPYVRIPYVRSTSEYPFSTSELWA